MVFVDENKVVDEQIKKDWEEAGVVIRPYGIEEVGKYIDKMRDGLKAEDQKQRLKLWSSASMSWALAKACGPVSSTLPYQANRFRLS